MSNPTLLTIIATVAAAVITGLLAWIANTTQANAVQLATITQALRDFQKRAEDKEKDVGLTLADLRTRLTAVEVEVVKLKAACVQCS